MPIHNLLQPAYVLAFQLCITCRQLAQDRLLLFLEQEQDTCIKEGRCYLDGLWLDLHECINIPCPFGHILLTRPQLKGPQNSFFTIFPWEQELGQHLYSCTLETSWVCVRLFWLVHIHKSSQSLVLPLGEKERTIRTVRYYIILAMNWIFKTKKKNLNCAIHQC